MSPTGTHEARLSDERVADQRSNRWALWGVAAGVLGFLAHLGFDPQGSLTPEQRRAGEAVLDLVSRPSYHAGAVAGYLAVACLLIFAVAWRRWSDAIAPDVLAARLVPAAFTASAAAMIIGYGFKGSLAVYLPGGLDAGDYPAQGLYALFMINDLAPFFAWWGVAVAAAGVAWLAFRERLVVRWVGIASVLATVAPLVFLGATGLTGFAGVVGPIWLTLTAVGMARRRA